MLYRILWSIFWRIAIRVGKRDPEFPEFAWVNTRPRMLRTSNWIIDRYPEY